MTHEYYITGMSCGSCVAKVKSALLKLGDILSAEVTLSAPQARITMQKHVPTTVLQQIVSKAGHYSISEAGHGTNVMSETATVQAGSANSYFPIFLIFGFISGVTLLIQVTKYSFSWLQWMSQFMAGFFLVFSFFKLMNLKGFAEGYRTYDVVAKKFPAWGYIYPFVELGLGIAFLLSLAPLGTNIVAFVVMAISSVGVIESLVKKKSFQCACLGTIIRLPLSRVTLFEDLLMVAMSGIMIVALTTG